MPAEAWLETFTPPQWAAGLKCPTHRVRLCHLPTPVERLEVPKANRVVRIKRDDMTGGAEMTGNKTRKLEFLVADAISTGCDVVVTTGGQQSNHCRATAAACARVGLECRMTLRDDGHGTNGNYFLGGLLGAKQHVVPKNDWATNGGHSGHLAESASEASAEGRRPCAVPCGGSNATGVWGYLMCCDELFRQGALDGVGDIVCASGSGGTVAGLAIGVTLLRAAGLLDHDITVTSYCVCDTPEDFEITTARLYEELTADTDSAPPLTSVLRNLKMLCAVGGGYGVTTDDDIAFIKETAGRGIVFDRTYTGKALHKMAVDLAKGAYGDGVLFVHTGGATSVFDKHEVLQ